MAQAKAPKKATKKAKAKKPARRKASQGGSKIKPERLQFVERMMAAGCTRRDIVLEVVKQFKCAEKTAYGYIIVIEKEWAEESKHRKSFYRREALKELKQLLKMAFAEKKVSAGVRAVMAAAQVRGLLEPDEIVIAPDPEAHPTESMTSAQLRAFIAEKQVAREKLLAQVVAEPTSVH